MIQQLITQAKTTTDAKERDALYVKIYDIRSGGRTRVPVKLKIKEIAILIDSLYIDSIVNM